MDGEGVAVTPCASGAQAGPGVDADFQGTFMNLLQEARLRGEQMLQDGSPQRPEGREDRHHADFYEGPNRRKSVFHGLEPHDHQGTDHPRPEDGNPLLQGSEVARSAEEGGFAWGVTSEGNPAP